MQPSLLLIAVETSSHTMRNRLMIAVTILYVIVMIILFCLFRRANTRLAKQKKELQKQKETQQIDMQTSVTDKLDMSHPHKSETHTDH